MEALAAIGLAAAICQFVDFSSKIIREGSSLFKRGTTIGAEEVELVANDMKKLLRSVNQHLSEPGAAPITPEEYALVELANRCEDVITDILDGLYGGVKEHEGRMRLWFANKAKLEMEDDERLRLWHINRAKGVEQNPNPPQPQRQGEPPSRPKSLRNALMLVWNSKRLEELKKRLDELRAEISLRLLVILNIPQRQQSDKLDQLSRENGEIVEVLSLECNTLRLHFDKQHHQYTDLAHADREAAERRHAEVVAAILTTRGGRSTTISTLQKPDDILKDAARRQGQRFVPRIYRGTPDISHSEDPVAEHLLDSIDLTKFIMQIIDALNFRESRERQASIATAHEYTFQWIFKEAMHSDAKEPAVNFVSWLREGAGCYWVNGKAGSGKSTLMKFIAAHPSLGKALEQWSGSEKLITGQFFFWYAGSPLQRSQMGLLRSLLLSVLAERRELTSILFPEVIRSLVSGQEKQPLELTMVELRGAFAKLIETSVLDANVFFLIDGLDEYDGDHSDLADFFFQAIKSKRVKILLSSRPLPAYVYAFSSCPGLKLQDLTARDIRNFATSELRSHTLMQRLEAANRGATRVLVNDIVDKASGVFLWVSVVVKLIIRGLCDYDTITDLRSKLDQLPEELENLYSHMLRSMSSSNRAQGSRFLQLALRSSRVHGHFPMSLLQFSFAEDEPMNLRIPEKLTPMSIEDELWRLESAEGRLRSRCCGLVEVQDGPSPFQSKAGQVIAFLHRTVVEFLEDSNNWDEITSWLDSTKFDVDTTLLDSSLSEIKAKFQQQDVDENCDIAFRAIARIMTFEHTMMLNETDDRSSRLCRDVYIPHMKKMLFSLWNEPIGGRCTRMALQPTASLLMTSIYHSSNHQAESLLAFLDGSASPDGKTLMTRSEISTGLLTEFVSETRLAERARASQLFCTIISGPNTSSYFLDRNRLYWNSRLGLAIHLDVVLTPWKFLLYYLRAATAGHIRRSVETGLLDTLYNIVISFLLAGADKNVVISLDPTSSKKGVIRRSSVRVEKLTASQIVEAFCIQTWEDKLRASSSPAGHAARAAGSPIETLSPALVAKKMDQIAMYFTTGNKDQLATKSMQLNPKEQRRETKLPVPIQPVEFSKEAKSSGTIMSNANEPKSLESSWSSLPWRDWLEKQARSSQTKESPANATTLPALQSVSEASQRRQREIRWSSTSRSQRLDLLNETDQELVRQLVKPGSRRQERQLLGELRKRDAADQARIFECVETLKKS